MEDIKLSLGDCLDVMGEMESESVDLVFCDSPFNLKKVYGGKKNSDDMPESEYYAWCEKWITECFRLLKPTGTIYLMTVPKHLWKMMPMLQERGVFINQVIWRNVTAEHSRRKFWISYQPILVYGKTKDYTFNVYAQVRDIDTLQLRWGGYSGQPRGILLDYWDDIPLVYAGSVHHPEAIMKPGTNSKLHTAQMPIDLIKRPILFSTNPGDLVLEPFAGLAAGAVACLDTNRRYIGIEKEKVYLDEALARLERERAKLLNMPLL
jgi:DNA modification methylase